MIWSFGLCLTYRFLVLDDRKMIRKKDRVKPDSFNMLILFLFLYLHFELGLYQVNKTHSSLIFPLHFSVSLLGKLVLYKILHSYPCNFFYLRDTIEYTLLSEHTSSSKTWKIIRNYSKSTDIHYKYCIKILAWLNQNRLLE